MGEFSRQHDPKNLNVLIGKILTRHIGVNHEGEQNKGHHPINDNHIFVMVVDSDL